METTIKIATSLGVVAIFFAFYFRNFVFRRSLVLQTTALFLGMLSAAVTLVLQLYLLPLLLTENRPPITRALLDAALIEELVRFIFLYVYLRRSGPTFTVVEGAFDGILIGLGFALVENLQYGLNYDGFIILLRSLTSVPLHALLAGIMGFYISYAHLRHSDSWFSLRQWSLYGQAFLIPWALHAAYDSGFLLGGFTYATPMILIFAFLFLENLFYRARQYFGKNVLKMIGIDIEELDVFLAQQEYEKWLEDHQDEDRPPPSLFLNQWTRVPTILGLVCLGLATILAVFMNTDPTLALFQALQNDQVRVSLLVVFPATVGLMLLLGDKINYLYIRDVLLSVPMALSVEVEREGRENLIALTLDLFPSGLFLSDQEKFERQELVRIRLRGEHGTSQFYPARVRWSNRFNPQLPIGHIIRVDHRTPNYLWYTFRFQLWKLRRLRKLL